MTIYCTKEQPWDRKKTEGVRVAHEGAKIVGESSDGGADDWECEDCGTKWRDYLDQN